jgi:type IV secretory pathway VirB3-like protein
MLKEILFLALCRPALVFGVPFEALGLNVFCCFLAGAYLAAPTIWRSPIVFWLAAVPIHFALRQLTSYDYHWARTARLWVMGLSCRVLYSLPSRRPRSAGEVASSV